MTRKKKSMVMKDDAWPQGTSAHQEEAMSSTTAEMEPSMDMSRVAEWTCAEVADWLTSNGLAKYAQLIAYTHDIDGATLLQLEEWDLRQKPLEIPCLGDVKRLTRALASLRLYSSSSGTHPPFDHHSHYPPKWPNGVVYTRVEECSSVGGDRMKVNGKMMTREELIARVESPDTQAKTLFKMAVAFVYCSCALLVTAFVMVLVHDRTPDMKTYPPLPDIVLDNIPLIPWAFEVCEVIAVTMSTIWFTNLFFHKHRIIVMRRMFSLVGTVFLLRCVTMLITSLSVPGVHLECRAKAHGSVWEKLSEAYHIWSNLGLSIQGVRSCGDYMFSGHTTAITMLNHFITEYTPDSWHFLHTSTWVLNLFGIFFILAGHEHYSIDVFIAFYISSRLFLYYHAYAYNHLVVTATDARTRMWFPLGWFFEAGGGGRVENEYEFPLSLPDLDFLRRWLRLGQKEDQSSSASPSNHSNASYARTKPLHANNNNDSKVHANGVKHVKNK